MTPELAAAYWKLELLPSEDLPVIAMSWLETGHSSHNAAALTGVTQPHPEMSECAPLFEAALRDVGAPMPSRREAAWIVIRDVLARIDNGALDPMAGADFLTTGIDSDIQFFQRPDLDGQRSEPGRLFAGEELGFENILGLYWAVDDGADPAACAAEVKQEARRLLRTLYATKPDLREVPP